MDPIKEKGYETFQIANTKVAGVSATCMPGLNSNTAILGRVNIWLANNLNEKELREAFLEVHKQTKRTHILIDFHDVDKYKSLLRRALESENIITWKPYVSTNGSHMIISLIKLV